MPEIEGKKENADKNGNNSEGGGSKYGEIIQKYPGQIALVLALTVVLGGSIGYNFVQSSNYDGLLEQYTKSLDSLKNCLGENYDLQDSLHESQQRCTQLEKQNQEKNKTIDQIQKQNQERLLNIQKYILKEDKKVEMDLPEVWALLEKQGIKPEEAINQFIAFGGAREDSVARKFVWENIKNSRVGFAQAGGLYKEKAINKYVENELTPRHQENWKALGLDFKDVQNNYKLLYANSQKQGDQNKGKPKNKNNIR